MSKRDRPPITEADLCAIFDDATRPVLIIILSGLSLIVVATLAFFFGLI